LRQVARVRPSRANFGDGTVGEDLDQLGGVGSGGGQVGHGVGKAQLLGGPPGGGELAVGVAGGKPCGEPREGVGGEPVGAAA
jgi:hypothetical protein